jgi:hypothetical protein
MGWVTYHLNDRRPSIRATLEDDNGPLPLSDASSITIQCWDTLGTLFTGTCTHEGSGVVRYDPVANDMDRVGTFNLSFMVTWSTGILQHVPSEADHTLTVLDYPL